ncbi:MAG: hypothetical protein EOO48_11640 [Flavobacterium sp.]|nr:MAG: hypothetical protein EOO48_11640 [Flavobacterium sp.]
MKKIFLLVTLGALALSCSSDSGSGSSKLPSAIALNSGSSTTNYSMTYDDNDRLAVLSRNNGTTANNFAFSYDDGGRINAIAKTGDSSGITTFSYDSNGRLSSFTVDGAAPVPVTYSSGTYTVPGPGTNIQYTLNSRNDLASVLTTDLSTFNYDTNKKGIFSAVKGNYQVLGLFMDTNFFFIGSKKPVSTIDAADPANHYVFTNTFDSDGYLTSSSSTLGGAPFATATVTYE